MRTALLVVVATVILIPAVVPSAAQADTPPEHSPRERGDNDKASSNARFNFVEEMRIFEDMMGVWLVTEHHFNADGEETAKASGSEELTWEYSGRVLRRSYSTSTDWRSYRATCLLTWNSATNRFEGIWFDNTSTSGPTTVIGEWDAAERTMTYTMAARDEAGNPVAIRVVDRFLKRDHRIATSFVKRDGREAKTLDIEYKRPPPCPESQHLRTVNPNQG